jgi:hypothetical protein
MATVALLRIFFAAFVSASSEYPHETQRNVAWFGLFFASTQPQAEHPLLVLRGSTATIGTPARFDL